MKEEIGARGELVIRRVRSAKVDNVDVDLLVETDRRVYVVGVRPRVEDVGALLTTAEVVKAALGRETVPILTGTWIGDDVEKYARGKGVLISATKRRVRPTGRRFVSWVPPSAKAGFSADVVRQCHSTRPAKALLGNASSPPARPPIGGRCLLSTSPP